MKWLICILFLLGTSLLPAQNEDQAPPDPSDPPFQVGALPMEAGYTIEREEGPDLNFRIVENKIRLYWLDDEGLVVEPEVEAATIRFTGSVRGRTHHRLALVKDDTALGTSYRLPAPHRYEVVLVIAFPDASEPELFRFRYLPSMNTSKKSGS